MTCQIREVPFGDSLLSRLAADLLAGCPGQGPEDLADVVVLLPSRRACQTLAHTLFETAGRAALVLPRLQTLDEWAADLVFAAGLSDPGVPDDRIRPLALGPSLAGLPWLAGRPESLAPGLAAEFVRFFDLVRLNGRQDLLVDDRALDDGLAQGSWAAIIDQDLPLIREAWGLFRAGRAPGSGGPGCRDGPPARGRPRGRVGCRAQAASGRGRGFRPVGPGAGADPERRPAEGIRRPPVPAGRRRRSGQGVSGRLGLGPARRRGGNPPTLRPPIRWRPPDGC